MKTMYSAAALFSIAAFLPAAAQVQVNAHPASEPGASVIQISQHQVEINTLRHKLEACQQQLRAKFEQVEDARQEAISAGIQGDGAQLYIDVYRQKQMEADLLNAALSPQIEQTRATIAALSRVDSQASLQSRKPDPLKGKKSGELLASRQAF